MDEHKSKVYVQIDTQGRVVRIDGGYTTGNIQRVSEWILVDEGSGDRFNLCQSNYLSGPLMNECGVYCYKLENGAVVARTQAEMDEDAPEPNTIVTQSTEERIAGLEEALRLLLEGGVE